VAFLDNELDREILAVEALSLIEEEKVSEREALKRISNLHNITDWKIRSTLHALLFETLRYRNLIDFIINSVMEKGTIEKIKSVFLRNILRIGVYQIKIIKKQINLICNTLVELVKKKSSKRAANFVNAILRSAERFDLESELDKLNKKEYLALKYSHPKWFIELLSPYFSDEFIVSLMEQNNKHLPICIRVNLTINDINEVIEEFDAENYEYKIYPEFPDMIEIYSSSKPIVRTNAFKRNGIYIQSKSSILVSYILDPKPSDLIYDFTAAPGSKTLHIAQLMGNKGNIIAFDRSLRRLKELQIKKGLVKSDLINLINSNSTYLRDCLRYKADKILVDPPCSGSGTFSNRPFTKYKSLRGQLKALTYLQWKLLDTAVNLVKHGGVIVYSTCSITLEENEVIIRKLLEKYSDIILDKQSPFIGMKGFLGLNETQRLFPNLHKTEGFFIAKLRKK